MKNGAMRPLPRGSLGLASVSLLVTLACGSTDAGLGGVNGAKKKDAASDSAAEEKPDEEKPDESARPTRPVDVAGAFLTCRTTVEDEQTSLYSCALAGATSDVITAEIELRDDAGLTVPAARVEPPESGFDATLRVESRLLAAGVRAYGAFVLASGETLAVGETPAGELEVEQAEEASLPAVGADPVPPTGAKAPAVKPRRPPAKKPAPQPQPAPQVAPANPASQICVERAGKRICVQKPGGRP